MQLNDDEVLFYNSCLVFVFFKLKEFQNAKILSTEVISKLSRQAIFSVVDSE